MNVNQNRRFEWPKAQRTDIVCLADVAKESVFENEEMREKLWTLQKVANLVILMQHIYCIKRYTK